MRQWRDRTKVNVRQRRDRTKVDARQRRDRTKVDARQRRDRTKVDARQRRDRTKVNRCTQHWKRTLDTRRRTQRFTHTHTHTHTHTPNYVDLNEALGLPKIYPRQKGTAGWNHVTHHSVVALI